MVVVVTESTVARCREVMRSSHGNSYGDLPRTHGILDGFLRKAT